MLLLYFLDERDKFDIIELAMLDGEWSEKTYSVSGDLLDVVCFHFFKLVTLKKTKIVISFILIDCLRSVSCNNAIDLRLLNVNCILGCLLCNLII